MNTITVTYILKFELSFAPEYQWTDNGMCFNIKTGRQIRQTAQRCSIGYCIRGKFHTLTSLRQSLVKIAKSDCPF